MYVFASFFIVEWAKRKEFILTLKTTISRVCEQTTKGQVSNKTNLLRSHHTIII